MGSEGLLIKASVSGRVARQIALCYTITAPGWQAVIDDPRLLVDGNKLDVKFVKDFQFECSGSLEGGLQQMYGELVDFARCGTELR